MSRRSSRVTEQPLYTEPASDSDVEASDDDDDEAAAVAAPKGRGKQAARGGVAKRGADSGRGRGRGRGRGGSGAAVDVEDGGAAAGAPAPAPAPAAKGKARGAAASRGAKAGGRGRASKAPARGRKRKDESDEDEDNDDEEEDNSDEKEAEEDSSEDDDDDEEVSEGSDSAVEEVEAPKRKPRAAAGSAAGARSPAAGRGKAGAAAAIAEAEDRLRGLKRPFIAATGAKVARATQRPRVDPLAGVASVTNLSQILQSSSSNHIRVRGARQNNLKNVDVDIPKRQFVAFTGVSGSGKSSLVFDTIYAESRRQFLETVSAFARARLETIAAPDVVELSNLSTAIVIDQKRLMGNKRSTVGTITEVYTLLRVLYSRCGEPAGTCSSMFSFNEPAGMCPACSGVGSSLELDESTLLDMSKSLSQGAIRHPDFKVGNWSYKYLDMSNLFDMSKPLHLWPKKQLELLLHSEKIKLDNDNKAMGLWTMSFEGIVTTLKRRATAAQSSGDRHAEFFGSSVCSTCNGTRLCAAALDVKVAGRNIAEMAGMELTDLAVLLEELPMTKDNAPILPRLRLRVATLVRLGVGYLSLDRATSTLSGGESQRVKMARQLNTDLVDLMYVMDEPSVGLHPRDVAGMVDMLRGLRDRGNSVLVVEHEPDVIAGADWVVDVGPGAGKNGGNIVFQGTVEQLKHTNTLTGKLLVGRDRPELHPRRKPDNGWIVVEHATVNTLKDLTVSFPVGLFICITGVAGSGKSSLIHGVFCAQYEEQVVVIDQTPVNKNSRSNALTFTDTFTAIRGLFAKATGKAIGLFSFNSDGACQKCHGAGKIEIEMAFLESATSTCPECNGARYHADVLRLKYKGKNMNEVLNMTVDEACEFFGDVPSVNKKLAVLQEVGLGYLQLGQSLSSLSGGEAQRIKLGSELHKSANVYVMDEPTIGLHMHDVDKLLAIIHRLVDGGNTVIVIEHNMDVVRQADWVIDMGPEAGSGGGTVVAEGPPEVIAACPRSHTGKFLAPLLK